MKIQYEWANGEMAEAILTEEEVKQIDGMCDLCGNPIIPGYLYIHTKCANSRRRPPTERDRWEHIRKKNAPLVYERDGFICASCGTENDLTIDHVTPIKRGGTHDLDNLQVLCQSCNSRKGAR